MRYRKI